MSNQTARWQNREREVSMENDLGICGLKALCRNVLDFIGTEGVVVTDFAHRRDYLCGRLRAALKWLDEATEGHHP